MPMDAGEIERMIKAALPDATVEIKDLNSGLHGNSVIRRGEAVQLMGAADPRREGEAMGE